MIVTFHLVVFIAFHVWKKLTPLLFTNNNDDGSETNDQNSANTSSEPLNSVTTEPSKTGVPADNKDNPISTETVETENRPEKSGSVEGEGDLHDTTRDILFEYGGRSITYSDEPTFMCNFESEEEGMKFIPPVYTQRYMVIKNILKKPCWAESVKKVVDFGCAELTFELRYLKKLFGIQEILAVDIDHDLLSYNSCKVGPSPTDHIDPRPTPLTAQVFCGSVANTHEVLNNCDAVIAIELIEHLYPHDLECLPFTVFGYIRPKIAIFTTPNADFNVLFPNFSGFRHYDHKFEWTRQQFEDWGNNLVLRYPDYSVTFQGVGPGPAGTDHLGCCSQMATFIKVYNSQTFNEDELHVQDGQYTLINEYIYPYFVDKRTREEKLRDDAVSFINSYNSLSRQYDEVRATEIPLKMIMERINCLHRQKLKDVLIHDKWEIRINKDGYEVVVLPDSESENNDWCSNDDEELDDLVESYDVNCDGTLTCDENWDTETIESKVYTNSTIDRNVSTHDKDVAELNPRTVGSVDDNAQIDQTTTNGSLILSPDEKCSIQEAFVSDVTVVYDRHDSSGKYDVLEKDMDLDCSVYKTPYSNGQMVVKSDCELFNSASQSLSFEEPNTPKSYNKTLSFKTPSCNACELNNSLSLRDSSNSCSMTNSFCCVSLVGSPFDISTYATPCCSQLHKKYIPKCLSLQQINAHEAGSSTSEHVSIGEQKDKVSKSMEGFKTQEICDIHETSSNASRVVDSGYPDSYSEHNMDMDLTPEQFDDIETESEGDVSSRSLSPPLPPAPQIPRLFDDVQNGDVANNNRDGEGNNMVADMEEEPLEFEAQILEANNELPNLAAVDYLDQGHNKFYSRSKSFELNQKDCDTSSTLPKFGVVNISSSESPTVSENNKDIAISLDVSCNSSVDKSKESDLSIATTSTWDHLDCTGSQSSCDIYKASKLKSHGSLTTVLDGCSTFSNCSLVQPTYKHKVPKEIIDEGNSRTLPTGTFIANSSSCKTRGNSDEEYPTKENVTETDPSSIVSVYESAASLGSENNEDSPFPLWLLCLDFSEEDEHEVESANSVISVWDNNSGDETRSLTYDVQVDARGGGDPQRNSWN